MNSLLSGRSVLVVEDEMLNMIMIEGMLSDLGCQSVTVAATVNDALAKVATQTFDVAMLDMNFGGVKSYPVADALAARGVPFLFSTGYGESTLGEAYRDRPGLKKPFRPAEMVEVFRSLLPSAAAACVDRRTPDTSEVAKIEKRSQAVSD